MDNINCKMAIDRNLVICVGVAGVILVVVSMNNKKNQETPDGANEMANDLVAGKAELADLERRHDRLIDGDPAIQDWKIKSDTLGHLVCFFFFF